MARRLMILAALAAGAPALALAQTSPARIGVNRLDQNQPVARPGPAAHKGARARRPTPAVKPFLLREVRITGSTAPPGVLQAAYAPFIGKTVDGKAINAITEAVAGAYAHVDIAFYTVIAPTQDFSGGVLRLTVVEGYVQSATVKGDHRRAGAALAQVYADRLLTQRPLKKRRLERYISLIRDIPGAKPAMQLDPGDDQGAVRLQVDPDPHKVQFGAAINNRGTVYLGRTQLQLDAFLNSLFRSGDQTRFSVAVPTDLDRFQLYGLVHSQPLNADGTTLTLSANYLHTRPDVLDVDGKAYLAGVQVSHPVVRSYHANLYASLSMDGINSNNAFLGQRFSDERTRALRAGLSFSAYDDDNLFSAVGSVSLGLDILGARVDNPEASRQDFHKFNLKLAFNHAFTQALILRLSAVGQATPDLLPSSELMALGGDEFGRGYEAAFVEGDDGYAGAAELAFRPGKGLPQLLTGSEVYVFADKGQVRFKSRFGLPQTVLGIASAGGGVRISAGPRTVIELEAARGLENPVPSLNREPWRGIVSARTSF
jgi:hemolysin activation/secretion protein